MVQTLVSRRRHFTTSANGLPKYALQRGDERGARVARAAEGLSWVSAANFNASAGLRTSAIK
jgi:hypothetical protein